MRQSGWVRIAVVLAAGAYALVACGDANDPENAARIGNYPTVSDLPLPPGLPTPANPAPAGRDVNVLDLFPSTTKPNATTTTSPTPTPTTAPPPTTPPAGGGAADLVGARWHSEATHPEYGPIITDLTLQGNVYTSTTSAPNVYYFFYFTGTYEVYEAEGILRLKIDEYYPTEWCGPIGCTPIHMPDYETNHYTFLDTRTLRLVSDPCEFAPDCTVTYQRV